MSRGLGKIERWILISAYKKIVQKRLPDNWSQLDDEKLKNRLYRSEVLLNYFKLKRAPAIESYYCRQNRHHKFEVNNKTAFVSYGRTIKSLMKKGYIENWRIIWDKSERYDYCVDGTYITLTDKGKNKARELL